MKTKYTSISLSYFMAEESLATAGVYSNAEFSKSKTESYKTLDGNIQIPVISKPSKTVKEPIYHSCTQNTTLGKEFIEQALERPKKPFRRASIREWNVYNMWNKLTTENKLKAAVVKYVSDLGGVNPEFELM